MEETSYPRKLNVNWAKNQPKLFEIGKILKNINMIISLQSLDKTVLRNIKRQNIKISVFKDILAKINRAGGMSGTEIILGLPGETEETIEQTIAFAKKLPLDLALFHIAVPYPGTPFWYEALEQGWLRVQRWEDFDMYNSTVVEYPNLTAEQIERAARRAARAWSLRPGPLWTFLKEMRHPETLRQWLQIGVRYLSWIGGRD